MFDAYHKWLGIKPGRRPATHYQLLGIAPDERDAEVIREAAIRQTAHVRTYQIGAHAQDCTRLLNEIALAQKTLLDPAKRQQYDATLPKEAPAAAAVTAQPPAARPEAEAFAFVTEGPAGRARAGTAKHRAATLPRPAPAIQPGLLSGKRGLLLALAAGSLVPLLLFLLVLPLFRSSPPPDPDKGGHQALARKPDPEPAGVEPKKPNPSPAPAEPKKPDPDPPVPRKPDPGLVKLPAPPAPGAGLGKELRRIVAGRAVFHLAVTPDGRRALTHGSEGVRLWDLDTGEPLRPAQFLNIPCHGLTFLPDGRQALLGCGAYSRSKEGEVTSRDCTVKLLDLEGWRVSPLFEGHTAPVLCVAVSPDGRRALSGAGGITVVDRKAVPLDCTVRLWDVTSGKQLQLFTGHTRPVTAVAFAADGRRAFSVGDDQTLRVWDLASGQALASLPANLAAGTGRRAVFSA